MAFSAWWRMSMSSSWPWTAWSGRSQRRRPSLPSRRRPPHRSRTAISATGRSEGDQLDSRGCGRVEPRPAMSRSGIGAKRILFGILAFAMLAGMSPKPPAHTVEANPAAYQSWRNALVEVGPNLAAPGHPGFFGRLRHIESFLALIPPDARIPAVLYLHDCPGLKIEAVRDVDELAAAGFAVFAPRS